MDRYGISSLRFPRATDYSLMVLPELEKIAFHPLISDLLDEKTFNVTINKLPEGDYHRVVTARVLLYSSPLVHVTTASLLNYQTYDSVAHGYFKRFHHLALTAPCFAFASTIVSYCSSYTLRKSRLQLILGALPFTCY